MGSLSHVMVRSHLIFHILYMDSETIILNSLLRPLSDLPFCFLKFDRQQPSRVLYDVRMAVCDLLFHSSFARVQICSLPRVSHSVRICSMDSSESQWVHIPLCL